MFRMTYRTRVYFHGLTAAAIAGAANSITVMVVDPVQFNLFQGGATKLCSVAIVSAIVSIAIYLREHPLPAPQDSDFEEATAKKVERILTGTGTGEGGTNQQPGG